MGHATKLRELADALLSPLPMGSAFGAAAAKKAADDIDTIAKVAARIAEIDASSTEETWGSDLHQCGRLARGIVELLNRQGNNQGSLPDV